MEPREWDRVRAAYDQILSLPEAQRSVRLARIGQDDPRMRGMLDALLHGDAIANAVSQREPNAFTPTPELIAPLTQTDDARVPLPLAVETRPAEPPRDAYEVKRLLDADSSAMITTPRPPRRRLSITAGGLSLSAFIIIGLGAFALRRDKPTSASTPTWLDLDAPDSASAHSFGSNPISLSPDGSEIAYVGGPTNALWVRSLDDARGPLKIEGSDNARCPSFSPDGRWIVFTTNDHLVRIPASGGRPASVVDSTVDHCALWINDKQILFERNASLFAVSADGGAQSLVARFDTLNDFRELRLSQTLPNGKAVLVSVLAPAASANWELGTLSLTDGRVTRLGKHGVSPRYANGYLLYGGAGVFAAPFSLREVRVTGPETRLPGRIGQFTTSANERLAYMDDAGHGVGFPALVAVGTDGRARPLPTELHDWSSPRVSPDGQRVAVELRDRQRQSPDIWIYEFQTNRLTKLTDHTPGLRLVGWTKDSRRVVFLAPDSATSGPAFRVVRQLWDGTAPPRDFIRLPAPATTFTMGPRHGFGAFSVFDPRTSLSSGHIWVAPLDSPSAAKPYVASMAYAVEPMLSHNGELLAYTSDVSGRNEVYVRPLDARSPVLLVSDSGGTQPVWGSDDQHLYYRGPSRMIRVTIARAATMSVTRREVLFEDVYERGDGTNYDVIPGDEELLMISKNVIGRHVGIVLDWPALLSQHPR